PASLPLLLSSCTSSTYFSVRLYWHMPLLLFFLLSSFFFHDTAPTEIYTLSLHDALPICPPFSRTQVSRATRSWRSFRTFGWSRADRKSTRLNSSHEWISYAVFCLKKKKKQKLGRRLRENGAQRRMSHVGYTQPTDESLDC